MTKISVVINTLNDEKVLPRLLSSVKGWADEIVICDMGSSDKTLEISKKAGAKIYPHKKEEFVELARNFSLSKATGDWILVLDPDEEVSDSLKEQLGKVVKADEVDYLLVPRKNIVFGKWLGYSRWWPDYLIRFFRKGKVVWSDKIHEPPCAEGKSFSLEATEKNAIIHYHYESIEQYLERMNRYSSVQAKQLLVNNYHFSWKDMISKPVGEFFSRYFFGEGYKDGLHGLSLAGLQAFAEFVVYLKVWQEMKFIDHQLSINEVVGEMKKLEADSHYWQADILYKNGGGMVQRVKRKFKLS